MSSSDDAPLSDPFPPDLREQVDELLDAFERDRQAGGRTPITAFLEAIPSWWQAAVFRLMLRAECGYLADTDRVPDISAYFERYSEFTTVLLEEFPNATAMLGPQHGSANDCGMNTDRASATFAQQAPFTEPVASAPTDPPAGDPCHAQAASAFRADTKPGPTLRHNEREPPRVAIIGGGWAGLAAAVAAVEQGLQVELFEARARCGGRAGLTISLADGSEVDFCRHLALGCCTNWLDLVARTDCAKLLLPPEEIYRFVARDGRIHSFRPGRLPAPFHLAPALIARKDLFLKCRLEIGLALLRLAKTPARSDQSFAEWLKEQDQSTQSIGGFWAPIVLSALADHPACVSHAAARKVFVDGLLGSAEASRMIFCRRTMSEVIEAIVRWLESRTAIIHRRMRVESVEPEGDAVTVRAGNFAKRFPYAVTAVPWWQAERLIRFPEPSANWESARAALRRAAELPVGTIAAVHLRYRKRWTRTAHAMLVGFFGEWFFEEETNPAEPAERTQCVKRLRRMDNDSASVGGEFSPNDATVSNAASCCQVIYSGLHRRGSMNDAQIIADARRMLASMWPEEAKAGFLDGRVARHERAVFVSAPGVDRDRPSARMISERLLLAGDWTDSGWPATMEGAVRSGRLAVSAIVEHLGRPADLLSPDLPKGRLFRLLLG